jgi:hypothetical protein
VRPNKRSEAAQLTVRVAAGAAVLALSACLQPGELEASAEQKFRAIILDGSFASSPDGGLVGGGSGNGGVSGGATSGNGGAGPDPCEAVVTELMASCVATVCHGNDSSNSLKLEGSSGMPSALAGQKSSSTCKEVPYVDAVAPEKSLLLTKMTSKPPCGSPMPLGGKLPTEAQRACVLEWIKDGIDGPNMPPTGMDGGTMPAGDAGCTRGDTDRDGTNDCDDMCINDAEKTMPGMCGCGMPDEDSDDDGALDCEDDCPMDPAVMMGECNAMMPGLRVGELAGNPNTADDNPGTMIDPLGPVRSEDTDNPVMTTVVYTGQIRVTSTGVLSFYENYDDSVRLFVDGMMLLSNGTWDEPTAAVIMRPEGWYDFELRLGNGATLSGPPPDVGIAFGYSPMDRDGSTNAADYMLPRNMNATTGNLFVTGGP